MISSIKPTIKKKNKQTNMKKIRNSRDSWKAKVVDKVNPRSSRQGITQSLLDKYRPSTQIKLIDGYLIKNKAKEA